MVGTAASLQPSGTHCEHKSCAVKLLAYTLDRSIICASALQQKPLFPQQLGIALFSVFGMVRAVRRGQTPLSLIPIRLYLSSNAQT
jgi:hypothetical protein